MPRLFLPSYRFQIKWGTLLSARFEFPYPLPAEGRTQIWLRLLYPPPGQRRKQV